MVALYIFHHDLKCLFRSRSQVSLPDARQPTPTLSCWPGQSDAPLRDAVHSTHGSYKRRLPVYCNHDREEARRFAQASKKGWEWAAEHPEETLEIVMKYVRQNHIGTNPVLQELMLKEVLRLMINRETGKREYRLRPDMVKLASRLMKICQMINREVTYDEIIGK